MYIEDVRSSITFDSYFDPKLFPFYDSLFTT